MNFTSINPYTEEVVATYAFISEDALEQAVAKAHTAQKHWKQTPVKQRVLFFKQLSHLLTEHAEELAVVAVEEMGKTLKEAKLEVLKCARGCDYYATQAEHLLQPQTSIAETGKTVELQYQPLGIVLGIFHWNFPYWQIIRSAVPTVIAGNAMLVKPAPNTPRCALALVKLIEQCDLPAGLIQFIFANESQIAKLLSDDRIQAATLTGSEKAGSAVASTAAKHIKKSVLELGGSDPFIVLPNANIETTLNTAITARFQNNGQSCIAAKRFIVHQSIADIFLAGLISRIQQLNIGNPLLADTDIGPLARKDLMGKLASQVETSLNQGAQLLYQSTLQSNSKGYFYPPTILGNITPDCLAWHEELFGPVISFYTFEHIEQAIDIANATSFGLGASIWGSDTENAKSIAHQIESGQVFINEMVKSQPTHPFGGVKKSGYGRELGPFGLYEFCNIKTVWY